MNNIISDKIDHLSFSKLALLDRSPKDFYKKYIEGEEVIANTHAVNIGSLIDCLLTEPDNLYNIFKVVNYSEPTGLMQDYTNAFIVHYKNLLSNKPDTLSDSEKQLVAHEKAYANNIFKISIEKVIERFNKEARDYASSVVTAGDKVIVTTEDFLKASACANALLNNKFTKEFLSNYIVGNKEKLYQLNDTFEILDGGSPITFKVKLDLVIVDHDNKTIQPLDIKTTGSSPYAFTKSMYSYRYDIQGALYSHYINHIFKARKGLEDYKVLDFKFIVVNVYYPKNPLIWKLSYNDNRAAFAGKLAGYTRAGIWELINDLHWHLENDLWDYSRELYETNGVLETKMHNEPERAEK
jgi:hypothetical protein